MRPERKTIQLLLLAASVVAVQAFASASGSIYYLTQLTMAAYYLLVIIGLCVLMGYTGQISLGHAGFFAMGGYTSAALTTYNLMPYREMFSVRVLNSTGVLAERTGLYGESLLNFEPWAAFIAAVAVTALVAYLIGGPVLRLKGHYLAMATLGFGTIIYTIVKATPIFGEADGINAVPPFRFLPALMVSGGVDVRVSNYYISWGLVLIGMVLLLNLMDSRVGRALRSIHGAEDAADAMGIDTSAYKLRVFVLSAVFAAVGGVFLTHYNGGIGPSEAGIMKSVRYVAIVAVGGMANLWGAVIMGALLNFLSLRGYFGSYDDAVFGAILILIMLFAPGGLMRTSTLAPVIALKQRLFGAGRETGEG